MMRDPAEVAEEERQKKELMEKAKAEKKALFKVLWEAFLQHFCFKDLVKVSEMYFNRCGQEAVYVQVEKASVALDCAGHPAVDISISREGAITVGNEWIQHRYGDRRSASKIPTTVDPNAGPIKNAKGFHIEQERWSLPNVVAFARAYQEVFLERDPMAGFNARDVDMFKGLFDQHKGSSPELKPQQLWGLLEEMNLRFPEKEDQAMVINVLNEVDQNKNGMLTIEELLHLVRRLLDNFKVAPREREHRLLELSGMEINDIEDWFKIFQETCDAISGGEDASSISIANIKEVFKGIDLKWDKEGTKQMKDWVLVVDEDYNGQIDFGEFCCLVQKMWDANFCGIRTAGLKAQ